MKTPTSLLRAILLCAGLLSTLYVNAQNPLWKNVSLEDISDITVVGENTPEPPSFNEGAGAAPLALMLTVPEAINTEIANLADTLDNDPVRIFNHVRNNIDYQHYHGIRKGAILTLLEGGGNSYDQCALLAELLKAAGHTNITYRVRGHRIDYLKLVDWMGLEIEPNPGKTFFEANGQMITEVFTGGTDKGVGDLVAKQAIFGSQFISLGGSASAAANNNSAMWHPTFPQKASIVFNRMFLNVVIGGVTYKLDPSYKTYEDIDGIDNILSSIGYLRSDLLNTAGGTTGTGYVKSLNNSNVKSFLEGLNTDLLDYLNQNHEGLTVDQLINGRRIIKNDVSSLTEAFPLPALFWGTNASYTTLPDVYKTKVRFKAGNIDYTIPTSELNGRKVSLTFSGNTVELRLDDETPVDTTSVSGSSFDLTITVTHHGRLGAEAETKSYEKNNNYAYAILYGFTSSGRLLQQRYEQLSAYLDDGKADDSREVRTEILNIMGLAWLYQTELVKKMTSNANDYINISHHRFGRMSQEEGFYIDVGLQLSAGSATNSISDDARKNNSFHLGALYASALEHGVIEQMQKNATAVSTVNIIRKASNQDQRIYLADSSNWSTVKGQITYGSSQENEFGDLINNEGAKLLLPRNTTITQDQWTGSGWVIRSPESAGMIISGGYSGGYSTNYGYVSSPTISTGGSYNPTYSYAGSSYSYFPPTVPPSYNTPSFFGADPVDMATGAFTFANTDMVTGIEESPRGLSFARYYTSNRSDDDSQHLGYGWTHALHIRCAERTAVEESFGLGTIQQITPLLTSLLVGQDLYRDDAGATEWTITALGVGWFVDQLKDNGVTITIGNNSFQFLKMPDGTYQAPAGSTMSLEKVSGDFRLHQRHGNTIYFENTASIDGGEQRVNKIIDPDGLELNFDYHGDDRIRYVQDTYGRRYTFSYYSTGVNEDRIESITDSTDSRFVGFRYDDEGNLDRFTDPEGKFFYYDYEVPSGDVPADPSATTADEHRIVRLRNHDDEIVTQNVYSEVGKVSEQYLHGDTAKTWKLRYTGSLNTEEDPEGGVTSYCYDERGRACGKIDASGKEVSWEYDGQDRIVKEISGTGEITIKQYDENHNLTQVDHPRGGGSTIYAYDSLSRVDLVTDPNGNQTDYTYYTSGVHQDLNRPYQVVDPEGTTTYQYIDSGSARGKVWKVTDGDNLVTEYAYDSFGHPDWEKAPGGFETDYSYTTRGDLDFVDDPNNIRTDYTYNNRRQVTKIERDKGGADESVEDRSYNNQGLLNSTTSAADNDNQRVRTRSEYSPTEKVVIECLDNESVTLTDDVVADHRYDGRDWVEKTLDASLRESSFIYFSNGEVQNQILPGNRTSTYAFDNDGRPTTTNVPGSNLGNRSTGTAYGVSDPTSDDQTTGYPKTTFTDVDNKTTTTEQDRNGQVRYYTNKKDETFEFQYDGLGRTTQVITPLDATNNRAHTTSYNHRGSPSLVSEPSGDTASFSYDSTNGRLQTVTYSGAGGGTVQYDHADSYDSNGNVKHFSEGSKHVYRTYDRLNRVKTHIDSNGLQTGYSFYPSGRLKKLIYPGGTESGIGHVEYTYWKTGRLKNVIDKLDSIISPRTTTYYWNSDGRLERVTRPNGSERSIMYDNEGRPEVIQESTSTGQLIHLSKHGYFPSDELAWSYNLPKAPPIQRAPLAPITSASYRSDNSLDVFNGASVTHDDDGNLTTGAYPNGNMGSYGYDSRNRLLTADGLSYTYNSEGTRLTNSEDGGITYVTESNLGLSKILQRTKNGQITRYVWGAGLIYEVNSSGDTTTYHYNSSGSTVALTDTAQNIIERMDYSPFGQTIYRESLDGDSDIHDTPFLFTGFFGNQTDANGLIYMRARYYNPLLRRFLNSDPAREAWNWYGYAGGNPIAFVDPTGLGISGALNAVQDTLSFLGMIPVVGNVFDAVNVGISIGRGQYGQAALHAAAFVPIAGLAVGGVRLGAKAFRKGSTDFVRNTGSLGGRFATTRQINAAQSELSGLGIGFNRKFKGNGGSFNFGTNPTVSVPKRPTQIQLFHEVTHARQFSFLGRGAYTGLGKYARETHVFRQIWKNRRNFNRAEVRDAAGYLRALRYKFRVGAID
ncbi:MAG: RHS repeat-associated core domain-containing protein [Akkermansiaceae bacterium]